MKAALKFVVLLGIVSLLADVTYEGARSITGPYLATLGASGTIVGIAAGLGELLGYGLRLVSGYISDRTRQYWTITLLGYGLNLLAVPLLALAGHWQIAVLLMIAERMGKAIRSPARDAMLSYATQSMGHGWGFGLHEALDQIGAVSGPLIIAAVLYFREGYRFGFAILLVPALLALSVLVVAQRLYPRPQDLQINVPQLQSEGIPRSFWFYLAAIGCVAAGYADFPLIAYHFQKTSVVTATGTPILYAVAMGVDALAALLMGRLFDRMGALLLVIAVLISALFAPLVFLGSSQLALLGITLWGVGMGAQESVMRAAVAQMVPSDKRGSAYGLFGLGYGLCWFLGSGLMGILYDVSIGGLVAFSVVSQLAAIPLLLSIRRPMGT